MRQLFFIMGIIAGTVGMGLFSLSGIFTRERVVQSSDEPKMLDCFRYLFKNKPLLLIVLSNILCMIEGITDTFSQYFYLFSLGKASWGTIIGIPGVVSGYAAYAVIPWLEKRWSSRQIVIRLILFKAALAAAVFAIGFKFYTKPAVIVPLLMVFGFINSAITSIKMVIPTKMIGDTVDYMEWKTGERGEGMSFSLLTFISKLTGSLCTAVAAAIIPIIGLEEVNDQMMLAPGAVNTKFWLWALITIIPAATALLGIIPYLFYDLEGKKLENIHAEMAIRREKLTKEAGEDA